MDFYKRAQELKEETIADRRYLHTHAAVSYTHLTLPTIA